LRVFLHYGERLIDSWKISLKDEPFGVRVGEHTPSAEVCETSEAVVVRLQVPGARREDPDLPMSRLDFAD